MLIIMLLVDIMVLSNCNLFLVFHIYRYRWCKTSFLLLGRRDRAELVNIYVVRACGLWWPSAAIVNFQFENYILFKKEIQTYFKFLKHLSFQSNLQMK